MLLGFVVVRQGCGLRPNNGEHESEVGTQKAASAALEAVEDSEAPHGQKTFEVLRSGHLMHALQREEQGLANSSSAGLGQELGLSLLQELNEHSSRAKEPPSEKSGDAASREGSSPEDSKDTVPGAGGNDTASPPVENSPDVATGEESAPSPAEEKSEVAGGPKQATDKAESSPAPPESTEAADVAPSPAEQEVVDSESANGEKSGSSSPGEETLGDEVKADLKHLKLVPGSPEYKRAERVAKTRIVMRRLERDLEAQDLESWSNDLKQIEILLKEAEPHLIDVNAPPGASSALAGERLGRGAGGADSLTFLGRAAGLGWLPGVQALVEWDQGRADAAPRLRLNDGGKDNSASTSISPLTLAAQNSHASVVRYLLKQGASPMVPDQNGRTPLELAAAAGDADVIEALLVRGSPLAYGLAPLWLDLAKDAEDLPRLDQRWPFGAGKDDVMDHMRQKVSDFGIAPSSSERELIGERPADWILLYKSRIMRALSEAPNLGSLNAMQAEALLSIHTYDSFARGLSLSIIMLFVVLGMIFVFIYVLVRIRLFGGPEVPVCLAHMVPGSFDPIRLADPDFDPSRQTQRFPYKDTKDILAQSTPSVSTASVAFVKALLGVFSSWLFLSVRIPPVKDAFDEDFLSDDDDVSRVKVCDQCAHRARLTQKFEVCARSILLISLLWWLCWQSQRWAEASILIFIYLQFSLIAASVAAGAMVEAPEQAANPSEKKEDIGIGDSARMVYALFGVQHGPRWARAVCSTRSTAAPSKSRIARRQRTKRSHGNNPRSRKDESSDGAEDILSSNEQQDSRSELNGFVSGNGHFFESWQRSFLQSGMMHIEHLSFLEMTVPNMVSVGFTLLWLTHLRLLAHGSFHNFYATASPAHLLQVYGAPGSGGRAASVLLELALLFLVSERLHTITGLLQAAALSLQQRYRALLFTGDHPPPPVIRKSGSNQDALVKDMTSRIEEYVRCCAFASDLSGLRWAVLRTPVLLVFTINVMLLALSIVSMLLRCAEMTSDAAFPLLHNSYPVVLLRSWNIDPMVPLGVGLCLAWPLMLVMVAATLSNGEVFELRRRLRHDVTSALTDLPSGEEVGDVQYVALRLKAEEALQDSTICWPGGRELSLCEPSLLLIITAVACGLAVATGSALPGAVGGLEQSLL